MKKVHEFREKGEANKKTKERRKRKQVNTRGVVSPVANVVSQEQVIAGLSHLARFFWFFNGKKKTKTVSPVRRVCTPVCGLHINGHNGRRIGNAQ